MEFIDITQRPTVSVVIPARNEEKYIANCITALKNNTIPPDEIIIVDSSSDSTPEIARRLGAKVVTAPPEMSLVEVRNLGAKSSRGSIIATTDSDCEPPPCWIKRILEHFKDPDVVAVTGGYKDIDDQLVEGWMVYHAIDVFHGLGGNMAFRRTAFDAVGGYTDGIKYKRYESVGPLDGEDVKLWKKLTKYGKAVVDKSIRMPTHIEGLKWGAIPVLGVSGGVSAAGFLYRKKDKNIGNAMLYGGLGSAAGEIGHQIVGTKFSGWDHDLLGLLGLGITGILDYEGKLKKSWRVPAYAFFSGLVVHHLATEGSTILGEKYRWSLGK